MTNHFNFQIPRTNELDLAFSLGPGDVVYVLGANGSGKSALISRLFLAHSTRAKKISAHRQTWFQSNTLDMTPAARQSFEGHIRQMDTQHYARYRLDYGSERAGVAMFDLIDSDDMLARKIAELVRAGDIAGAEKEAKTRAPIQVINELMLLSNIPVEISLVEGREIIAKKNGGPGYSVAELSDGERNAFLISADVLTAKPGTLLLIDEPERHLHRAIISPLLKMLFDERKDCTFIVSTHELMLPLDTPQAATLLVRECEFNGGNVRAWTLDKLQPGAPIDDQLKQDLLGSRRKMIFVEGTRMSLDAPLYSLLFPQVSVVPKDTCRDVEYAVRGLRGASEMHWIAVWGIVDNDQRTPENVERLRRAGIWALTHYSVESLYYHSKIIRRVAERQAAMTGADADSLVNAALIDAIAAAKLQKDHLVNDAVLRAARQKLANSLPTRDDIAGGEAIDVHVDIPGLRSAEKSRFDAFISSADWDGLLTRYPMRESQACDRIVAGMKVLGRETYRPAVLKLLQDDEAALSEMRGFLGGLYSEVSA